MAKYTTVSISFILIYLVYGGIVKGQGNLNDLPNHTENTMEHSDQRDGKRKPTINMPGYIRKLLVL